MATALSPRVVVAVSFALVSAGCGGAGAPGSCGECGEGFQCLASACVPDRAASALAEIILPAAGTLFAGGAITVDCRAQAPQLRRVLVTLEPPSPHPALTLQATALGEGERHRAIYAPAMGARQSGLHRVRCEARFGPPGSEWSAASEPVELAVDSRGPALELESPEAWLRRVDLRLAGRVVEEEGEGFSSGFAPEGALVATLEKAPLTVRAGEAEGTFEVALPLGELLPTGFVGRVGGAIRARDLAGNGGSRAFLLRVDDSEPAVEVDASAASEWSPRSGPPVLLRAVIETPRRGAPLAGVPAVEAEDTGALVVGQPDGEGGWVFALSPAVFSEEGAEGEARWTVRASNAAGGSGEARGVMRVDDRAPQLDVPELDSWHLRGPIPLLVRAPDSGSGTVEVGLRVAGGPWSPCTEAMGGFTCVLDGDEAPEAVATSAWPVEVRARDAVGNEAQVSRFVRIDDAAPVLAFSAPTRWFRAGEQAALTVSVTDAGSGVAPGEVRVAVPGAEPQACAELAHGTFICSVATGSGGDASDPDFPFVVSARDRAGNPAERAGSLRVDGRSPVLQLASDLGWHRRSGGPRVEVGAEDDGAGLVPGSVRLSVAGYFEDCEAEGAGRWSCGLALGASAESGEERLAVELEATDAAGNVARAAAEVGIDGRPPQLTVPELDAWFGRGPVALHVQAADLGSGLAEVKVRVSGGAWSPCADGPEGFTCAIDGEAAPVGEATGDFSFEVLASDAVGNEESVLRAAKIDDAPPVIDFATPTRWYRTGEAAELAVTVTDAGSGVAPAGVRVLMPGAEPQPCGAQAPGLFTCTVPTGSVGEGEDPDFAFAISVRDRAGNEAERSGSLRVDGRLPSLHLAGDLGWHRRDGGPVVEVGAEDAGAGLAQGSVRLAVAGHFQDCAPAGLGRWLCLLDVGGAPELTEALYPVELEATDGAGNVARAAAEVGLDGRAPQLAVPELDEWSPRGPIPLLVHAQDFGSGVDEVLVRVVGAPWAPCHEEPEGHACVVDGEEAPAGVATGELLFEVRASDRTGNEASVWRAAKIDDAPPQLELAIPTRWFRAGEVAEVAVSLLDPGSGVSPAEVRVSAPGVEALACEALSPGQFTCAVPTAAAANTEDPAFGFVISAVDRTGNRAEHPGSLRVDGLIPTVLLADDLGWHRRSGSPQVEVGAEDGGAGLGPESVRLTLEGRTRICAAAGPGRWSCPLDLGGVPDSGQGQYVAHLEAVDGAGNVGIGVAQVGIDGRPPLVIVGADTQWRRTEGLLEVIATVSDGYGSGVSASPAPWLRVEGPGAARPLEKVQGTVLPDSRWKFSFDIAWLVVRGLTLPQVTLRVTALDAVGNEGSATATRAFDDEPPRVTPLPPPYPPGTAHLPRHLPAWIEALFDDPGTNALDQPVLGSGVDGSTVRLEHGRREGGTRSIEGTEVSPGKWRFRFEPWDTVLEGVDGAVTVTFRAADRVGGVRLAEVPLGVTRRAWDVRPFANPTRAGYGLAASGDSVVLLTAFSDASASHLVLLDRHTGLTRAAVPLPAPPQAPPAVGQSRIYVVVGNHPTNTLLAYPRVFTGTPGPLWSAVLPSATTGRLALAAWRWSGLEMESETVLVATYGGVYAYRDAGEGQVERRTLDTSMTNALSVSGMSVWTGPGNGSIRVLDHDPLTNTTTSRATPAGNDPPYGIALAGGLAAAPRGGRLQVWSSALNLVHSSDVLSTDGWAVGPPMFSSAGVLLWLAPEAVLHRHAAPSWAASPGYPVSAGSGTAIFGMPALAADGFAYVFQEGEVNAFGPGGVLAWSHDTGARGDILQRSPVLGCEGLLHVVTDDARVVTLASDSGGLADGWPRWRHDNRNTGNAGTPIRDAQGHCIE